MEALKYMPKVGDILLRLDGSSRIVKEVDQHHAKLTDQSNEWHYDWAAIPHIRERLIKGQVFIVKSKNDEER